MLSLATAYSQNTLRCVVRDKEKFEPLQGVHAAVAGTSIGGTSDTQGSIEIKKIPDGRQTIVFSYIGYETQRVILEFPLPAEHAITVYLEHGEIPMAEVTVSSTRSSRAIEDEPTRVEPIVGEELDEKTGSHPANISMLFKESTGIQVLQTSAVSANANIRMQGLEGKYTQLLKDGLPLYSGLASGLSIMQIPPLDLQQVEVIKGSTSTLYGGGAIAGLINLVTKEPAEAREGKF